MNTVSIIFRIVLPNIDADVNDRLTEMNENETIFQISLNSHTIKLRCIFYLFIPVEMNWWTSISINFHFIYTSGQLDQLHCTYYAFMLLQAKEFYIWLYLLKNSLFYIVKFKYTFYLSRVLHKNPFVIRYFNILICEHFVGDFCQENSGNVTHTFSTCLDKFKQTKAYIYLFTFATKIEPFYFLPSFIIIAVFNIRNPFSLFHTFGLNRTHDCVLSVLFRRIAIARPVPLQHGYTKREV